jgi:hypothetical protein
MLTTRAQNREPARHTQENLMPGREHEIPDARAAIPINAAHLCAKVAQMLFLIPAATHQKTSPFAPKTADFPAKSGFPPLGAPYASHYLSFLANAPEELLSI